MHFSYALTNFIKLNHETSKLHEKDILDGKYQSVLDPNVYVCMYVCMYVYVCSSCSLLIWAYNLLASRHKIKTW